MKPIPKPEPQPFNPERRRFLRTALLTGAAFAAGCKSEKSSTTSARVFQNRPFPVGNASISLKGCSDEGQTARFDVSRQESAGLPDSITLLVPGSFSATSSGKRNEIYVESVSCNSNPQSAVVSIMEPAQAGNTANSPQPFADLPVIGAAIAFLGTLVFLITHRRHAAEGGIILSPKRH